MKKFTIVLFYTFFLIVFLPSWAVQPNNVITVELQNNCGRKVSLEVELAFNKLNTSMENGTRNKFKLKVGSAIKVNQSVLMSITAQENGKVIFLCRDK
jgi:hypothetical protein